MTTSKMFLIVAIHVVAFSIGWILGGYIVTGRLF